MSRVVDREARREQIVVAAAAAFAQGGVANTTISDIVKTAGVAQGTFYLYFSSKDEAILAVAEHLSDAMLESIEKAAALPGRPAVEQFLALSDTFANQASLSANSELIEIIHRRGNSAIHDRLTDHLVPRLVSIMEGIIEHGVAEGVFQVPDVHTAAWFVLGGLRSIELSEVPLRDMPAAFTRTAFLALRALGYEGTLP